MMFLIELNGEQMLVASLDGHEGWTVVASDVLPPPSEAATWRNGAWAEDAAKKSRRDDLARLNRMDRLQFLEECVRRAKL